MKKTLVKNTAFNVGYKTLNVFFPLISSMYVARVLGSYGVGRVAYAQNILSYFLVFASVGIPTYGIKEIARKAADREQLGKPFSEMIIINAVTTTVCILVYILLVILVPAFHSDQGVFYAVGITLYLNYFNIDWLYAGIEEYVYITVRSTIIKVLAFIALFVFVRSKEDVINYALISSIGLCANYILNIINARNKVTLTRTGLEIKRHIKPVVILLMTMLATDLYNQIDVTMLGSFCSKSEVGHYSYAIKLVRIVTSIATALSATMLPRLSQYYSTGMMDAFRSIVSTALNAVIMLVAPCVAGVTICADSIITIFYGKDFLMAIPLLQVLSPIIFIISISYLCGSIVLTAMNREKYLLYATLAGAVMNIMLNAVLIPRLFGIGAAVASVIAESLVFIIHYASSRMALRYRFFSKDNIKTLISTLTMILVILLLKHYISNNMLSLFLSVSIGATVYFLVLYALRHQLVRSSADRIISAVRNTHFIR